MSAGTNISNIPQPEYDSARRSWYVVAVLTIVSVFAFIDRQILSLLVQPIRRDLAITDVQMSLLLGFSFAVSFTLFVIPLGRLADNWSRRTVLMAGFVVWSVCTAACGLVRNFGQMMLLRMGVGMGEATLNPCAFAIITDSFPEQRRATALSVYSMGMYIGSGIAFLTGGLIIRFAGGQQSRWLPFIGPVRPWQIILLEVGAAGLLFTALLFTVREPMRVGRGTCVPVAQVLAYMYRNRVALLCHNLGFAAMTVAVTAGAAWMPEMFRRVHGWDIPRFSLYFGVEAAVFGCLGVVTAGRLADRLLRRGTQDANLRVANCIAFLSIPVSTLLFLAPSGNWAILWLAPGAALVSAPYGVAAAALQQILPEEIRSQMTAVYLLTINLLGAAMGPTLPALLTEHLFRREDALNYALLIVHIGSFLSAFLLLRAGRSPFLASIARLRQTQSDVTL